MTLTSGDFGDGAPIPAKFGPNGVSPSLSWSGEPAGTKSFVLSVVDPDAPGAEPFVHWLVYDIPATVHACAVGIPPDQGIIGSNDGGTSGYFGPQPPSGTHHYVFQVLALDSKLGLPAGASMAQVKSALGHHPLALGSVTGTYSH